MKIIHICLASAFTEGMTYQDNMLSEQNARDGHCVMVVADCMCFVDGQMIQTPPEDRVLPNGVRLKRLPFDRYFSNFISDKIRKTKLLKPLLEEFKPDIILFHGCCGWELYTVARYKILNPSVKLYVDSHEDFHTSARNFLSRNILHRVFYKHILHRAYPSIDKILYLSLEVRDFIKKVYCLPDEKLEFYPIGGFIFEESKRIAAQNKIKNELGLSSKDILLMHSGKLDQRKRTKELINAFSAEKNPFLKMIIIGSIPYDMKSILLPLIEADDRIKFLGWKTSDELLEYLCSCDLYLQPGGQSATMQNAICCGAPVMIYPFESHVPYMKGNGFFVESQEDMAGVFSTVAKDPAMLKKMSENSYLIAHELLDYRKLASRLYK